MPGISGGFGDDTCENPDSGLISLQLTDIKDNLNIYRVSLMRTGEYSKDGRSHQVQNISFNRETSEILWNPCNDNACSYASFSTSGGNNGRDELILEVTLINPAVDLTTCHGDSTCERLRGGVVTTSGMLDGVFQTGHAYQISVKSLQSGIGQHFMVTEG